ncbi:PREDICTED: uncharacterized protein LOC108370609 isoform X2 [Rhagoletis zephyria]|uniref:uncharacterized protein LOC108370609 isoform X2 n=1 Tax=Rhagoletis zephyria TaxID=28612 RepID=UPI0008118EA5|nr:PREDICTED: uncharacterized protein LOC108370609 isoform X2 [Rhagoletis zephyria]
MNSIMLSDHIQRFYGIREVTLHCRMFKSHTEISVLIYTAVDRKLKRFLSLMFNEKIPPIAYLSLEPSSSIKLKSSLKLLTYRSIEMVRNCSIVFVS